MAAIVLQVCCCIIGCYRLLDGWLPNMVIKISNLSGLLANIESLRHSVPWGLCSKAGDLLCEVSFTRSQLPVSCRMLEALTVFCMRRSTQAVLL